MKPAIQGSKPLFELRGAREEERDQIAKIWHTSASLPDVGPPQMPSYEVLRARVDEELASGWSVTVAVAGGEIAGFVALRPAENYLAELFVSPSHLGCGLGKRLLDHAKSVMQDGFTLFTTTKNARARRFYEREGLTLERESLHPRAGHPITYYCWNGG
ncbi:GNAT family N-acetyltransferase [Paracoccus cavernae]